MGPGLLKKHYGQAKKIVFFGPFGGCLTKKKKKKKKKKNKFPPPKKG